MNDRCENCGVIGGGGIMVKPTDFSRAIGTVSCHFHTDPSTGMIYWNATIRKCGFCGRFLCQNCRITHMCIEEYKDD